MSSLTTNPVNLAAHRAQLVADAVVSSYLSEISRPQPSRRVSSASSSAPKMGRWTMRRSSDQALLCSRSVALRTLERPLWARS
jgi:hypothetical protein